MKTLSEIEQAAQELPPPKQIELFYFLARRLGEANLPLPPPREFSGKQLQEWLEQDEEDMRRFRANA